MGVIIPLEPFDVSPELPGISFSVLCSSFDEVFPVCIVVEFKTVNDVCPEMGKIKPHLVIVLFVLLKPTTVAYEESLCFYGWFKCIDGCVCCLRNCCVSCVEYAIE